MKDFLRKQALPFILIAVSCSTGLADPVAFTWDPSKSSPALSGQGSSFTADTINVKPYTYSLVANGASALQQILQITGFQLNGQSVVAPGLNSSYGLYFKLNGSAQSVGGVPTFSYLDVSLNADPGNNNGTLSSTVQGGLAFSNGASGDIVLGSGKLVSTMLNMNAAGINAHFVQTFGPAEGQSAFFGNDSRLLDILLASDFVGIPQPDGTFVALGNNGSGQVTL